MKPITIGLIGFMVFAGWTTFSRYHFICKMLDRCEAEVTATDIGRSNDLSFFADGATIFKNYEQFSFDSTSSSPILTDNNKKFINKLAKHLKAHPNEQLTITGRLTTSEKGVAAGMFENLGIARATAIREELVKLGVKNSIVPAYKLAEDLSEPLSFTSATVKTDEPVVDPAFVFSNMDFSEIHFEPNSFVFKPNEAFNHYADSVKNYFVEHPNKVLTVTGHTDTKGSEQYNMELGLKRAKAVRQYLMNTIGINGKRIKTASKGESAPAFLPADTEENQVKNRRVNIKIE